MKRILLTLLLIATTAFGTVATLYEPEYFTCNGSTTAFVFTFRVEQTSDVDVYLRTIATGVEDTLTLNSDYSLSATNNDYSSGGTVTTVSTYSSTYQIIIGRSTELTQEAQFVNNKALENTLDRSTMSMQEVQNNVSRALRAPIGDESPDMELPSSVDRKNKYLAFGSDGNPTVTEGTTSDIVVSAYMETLVDDVTAADARTTLELGTTLGWVDVRAYGASTSASAADNTTAFNSAFENFLVFIPAGEYNLNALDLIDHPIHIKGVDWQTILNFDTTSDCIKFTITVPPTSEGEGVIVENIRFKNTSNTPASFINIDDSTNTKLIRLIFLSTTATAAIINQASYGLNLHGCRWNFFTGTALKLLMSSGAVTYSYAINLYSCDFTNITGTAIDQQGGDLKIFGGVIESSDSAGFVKLATNFTSTAVLFSGVYFEGTNQCFVLAPPSGDYWPLTVTLIGCNTAGSGNWFDVGYKGQWNFIGVQAGGGGPITIKGTNNGNIYSPRIILQGCIQVNFIMDATIGDTYSIIGQDERIVPTTSDGSIVWRVRNEANDADRVSADDDGLLFTRFLKSKIAKFSGTATKDLEIDTTSGSGAGMAIVLCSAHTSDTAGYSKLYHLTFAKDGSVISQFQISGLTLSGGAEQTWTFSVSGGILKVASTNNVNYKVSILFVL